jgi:hypothetical protein
VVDASSVGQLEFKQAVRSEPLGSVVQHSGGYLEFRSNPSPVIRELQRAFCGKAWDSNKNCWIKVEEKSLANDEFMRGVMPIIHAYVNPNTPRGNITESEAHRISERATIDLIFLIGLGINKFGIAEETFDSIINTFDDLIFLTLTRAIGDMERNHDDNVFKVQESVRGGGVQGTNKNLFKMYGG